MGWESTSEVRDGSKFMGYPGQDHRQGGAQTFFSKKIRGGEPFFRKLRGKKEGFFST